MALCPSPVNCYEGEKLEDVKSFFGDFLPGLKTRASYFNDSTLTQA